MQGFALVPEKSQRVSSLANVNSSMVVAQLVKKYLLVDPAVDVVPCSSFPLGLTVRLRACESQQNSGFMCLLYCPARVFVHMCVLGNVVTGRMLTFLCTCKQR